MKVLEGIALVFEEVEVSEPGFVICKSSVVPAPFDCSNWCRLPEISMDFAPKLSSPLPLPPPAPLPQASV